MSNITSWQKHTHGLVLCNPNFVSLTYTWDLGPLLDVYDKCPQDAPLFKYGPACHYIFNKNIQNAQNRLFMNKNTRCMYHVYIILTFHLHRLILALCLAELSDICEHFKSVWLDHSNTLIFVFHSFRCRLACCLAARPNC